MMENVDLPPPYSAVIDVSTPPSDVLITPPVIVKKQTIDVEPLVGHPFDDKIARMAFIQKILLYLLLQALVITSLVILIPLTFCSYYWDRSIYAFIFLGLYLLLIGVLLISDKARTTNPYKAMIFVAYPIIFAVFISYATQGYRTAALNPNPMIAALSCYCVALFALLAYSVLIFQTSWDYRPRGGIFIATIVLLPSFVLTLTLIYGLDYYMASYYMISMLLDCIYTVWEIHLITSPKYRYAVHPSDIMLGVLLIRIDLTYYILTYIKKCLIVIFSFKD